MENIIPLYLVVELANGDWVMGLYPDPRHPMGVSLQFPWTAINRHLGPMARSIHAMDLAAHVCRKLGGNPANVEVTRLGPDPHTQDIFYLTKLDRVTQVGTADYLPCEVRDLRELARKDCRGFFDRAVALDRALALLRKLRG